VHVPTSRYTSDDWARQEAEALWPRVWLLACHASRLDGEGSWRCVNVAGHSVLLWRDDETVHAFHNACPHRGSRLAVPGAGGRSDRLECGYHGWRFDRGGAAVEVPGRESFVEAPRGLSAVRCEVHAGFVWICVDHADGPDLTSWLGDAAGWLATFDLHDWSLVSESTTDLPCNWKASADLHGEAYHLPTLHAGALPDVDIEAEIELGYRHGKLSVPAVDTTMVHVFPHAHFNLRSDEGLVFRHEPDPDSPHRSRFTQFVIQRRPASGSPPPPRHVPRDDAVFGPVTRADLAQATLLQDGMRSHGLHDLHLTPQEALLSQMHRQLDRLGLIDD